MLRGVRDLLSFKPFPALDELGALGRTQLHVMSRMATAFICRGEDLRFLNWASLFTWPLPGVGPGPSTTEALCIVSNSGKTNKSGRRTTTGCMANKNALLCPIGALGASFVFRLQVMKEEHPSFTDYPRLFKTALIRATSQPHLTKGEGSSNRPRTRRRCG
jgi:hypothetical protein